MPGIGLHQIFVHDPEGVMVELNYPAAEKTALDAAAGTAAATGVGATA